MSSALALPACGAAGFLAQDQRKKVKKVKTKAVDFFIVFLLDRTFLGWAAKTITEKASQCKDFFSDASISNSVMRKAPVPVCPCPSSPHPSPWGAPAFPGVAGTGAVSPIPKKSLAFLTGKKMPPSLVLKEDQVEGGLVLPAEGVAEAESAHKVELFEVERGHDLKKDIDGRLLAQEVDAQRKTEPGIVMLLKDDLAPRSKIEGEIDPAIGMKRIFIKKIISVEVEAVSGEGRPAYGRIQRRPAPPDFSCQARGLNDNEAKTIRVCLSGEKREAQADDK